MSDRKKPSRDAFGFGLQGLRIAASYAPVVPVADDGINAAWDRRLSQQSDEPYEPLRQSGAPYARFWLSRNWRAAWAKEHCSQ